MLSAERKEHYLEREKRQCEREGEKGKETEREERDSSDF